MLGLVTTVAVDSASPRELDVLSSFLLYHLSVGFKRICVFLDTPGTTSEEVLSRLHSALKQHRQAIDIVEKSSSYAIYPTCSLYAALQPSISDEVHARQQLNCELAMTSCLTWNEIARTDASRTPLEWLVHLDLDELLYYPSNHDDDRNDGLHMFFASASPSIHQFTFVNHEAIPTTANVSNYFVEVSHFKVNHLVAPFTSAAQACMNRWRDRTTHRQYMLAYDNGKSAVRIRRGVLPSSVHSWQPHPSLATVTNFPDPRRMNMATTISHTTSPWILHYPSCGYDWFKEKYRTLGRFPDAWFQGKLPIQPCFHTTARDVWATCVETHDEKAMRTLYHEQVMLDDPDGLEAQIDAGVVVHLLGPSKRLQRLLGLQPQDVQSQPPPLRPSTYRPSIPPPAGISEVGYNSEKAWMLASIAAKYL
ncbi:hypothetical protein H310_02947 [Aphanomyces invadans]|uniref:Glycosyltransferase family 92 protein n=1 Tax=Aphanomyces invadans TaxID=157072 RepID=A0A024UKF7_9STRA|nr:hypothetical protein H310_02947 [Aphanomyces invadans]ETW06794.1 hypothetical protein H310_02947 [Aphanomyces invadans]|eukprot:XP_008864869.1 hypothetical protein H310_02947 [Aphanomyces invadans]